MKNSYELFLQWYVKCFFIELTLAYEKRKRVTKHMALHSLSLSKPNFYLYEVFRFSFSINIQGSGMQPFCQHSSEERQSDPVELDGGSKIS